MRRWALVATSLGFSVVQLDVSVVNVAVKPIGADLGGSVSALQWVVNAYTVAFAGLILSAGALGDRVGARRVFVAGFALFTLASAVCGLAPTIGALIAARAVQGVGAAALVPCSLSLLTHAYPESAERSRAVGLWAAGASTALSAGPLVGGLLTQAFSWRAIFFINAPIGLAGIVLTLRCTTETSRTERRIDGPGQVLAVAALGVLAGAMVEGGQRGFADPLVVGGLAVALALLAGFLVVEHRSDHAMLPLGFFRSRTFAAASAIGLVVNIAFYGLIFVFSLYFQSVHHYSALRTGLAFAPATALVLGTNIAAGHLAGRFGPARVLTPAGVLIAVSLLAMLGVGEHTEYAALVAPLIGLAAGLGLIVPVMTSSLLGSVEAERSGVASGTLNTARQTGSVIGVALFGSLAAVHLVSGLRHDLAIGAGLGLVAAGLGLCVRRG